MAVGGNKAAALKWTLEHPKKLAMDVKWRPDRNPDE
jgi:hypothetical protein